MQTEQIILGPDGSCDHAPCQGTDAAMVLVFGSAARIGEAGLYELIHSLYPRAILLGCSTAGEIIGHRVLDESLTLTAVSLDRARAGLVSTAIEPGEDSTATGARLAEALASDDLRHVLVLSDGLQVNGSRLVKGITSRLSPGIMVTGGLAADGDRFRETLVLADAPARSGLVAALGLYGQSLRIGWGSAGGWDIFGPKRLVTRSQGNVLYEVDGQPVLDLYKHYLGRHAAELPASALLFPLSVETPGSQEFGLVRTIIKVNDADGSMTFAGDIPEGSLTTLMRANFDRLAEGAATSARHCIETGGPNPGLALCISCVGRKLILKQRVEDETEAVSSVMGQDTTMAGFYSYGEISPLAGTNRCELHNQTMTITTVNEG